MRRMIVLVLLLLAVLPAATALAQSDPFQPPEVVVPTPTPEVVVPTPPPAPTLAEDDEPTRGFLFGIAGGVALILAGIGFYITRDARRNLTDADKRALEREGQGPTRMSPKERKQLNRAKARQRAAGKRQRQARKAQRRR